MLSTRGLLLFAWLILILSLFWDPYSILLTSADNTNSPFHVTDAPIRVQDYDLVATPYAIGARVFWTMLIPILPLFLMVFGHEAWRRICPLSFASQIPGYLGLRRYRNKFDRRTGLVTRTIALIDRKSWLARNAWYVQFGLLFIGVALRLLIINSDRHSLAIALISIIVAAMVTGILWGGKTWCNYFCPANIVQKIYTEPGGILESAPHFSRPGLPQSMCRKPSPRGELSACVACTASCGDIDLQGAYWNGLLEPQRRNVYYMFLGLVIGFYGYYYLYSGSWDYYFSGIWTHEDGIRRQLFAPGFSVFGHIVAIPKIIAAPLTLAVACSITLAAGRGLENLYRGLRSREEGMSEKIIVHHCLSVTAWLSINAFYLFGGRPNILLLPALSGRIIDVAIVALTTIWLRRALQHTPLLYQQEGMASSLLEELKKLKVNVSKFLDGRSLDKLRANEIYLLTKVLPEFSQQQKLSAYRRILDEAVTKGTTASSSSLKLLEDFRHQMNITEGEHTHLLEELGMADIANVDASIMTTDEKTTSVAHYRGILGSLVTSRLESKMAINDILEEAAFRSTVTMLRQSLQIDEHDHQAAIDELVSQLGIADGSLNTVMEALVRQKSIRLYLEAAEISDPLGVTLLELLLLPLEKHEQAIRLQALSILSNQGADAEFQRYAEDLASLADHELAPILRQAIPSKRNMRWRDLMHPKIYAILMGEASAESTKPTFGQDDRWTDRRAIFGSLDAGSNLSTLLAFEDPLIQAIGLTVFGYIEPIIAQKAARQLLLGGLAGDHPILIAATENVLGLDGSGDVPAQQVTLRATLRVVGQPEKVFTLKDGYITIGRASDNDIAIADASVWPYHLAINTKQGRIQLIRLDQGDVFVNGNKILEEAVAVDESSFINLGDSGEVRISIEGLNEHAEDHELNAQPIIRLAMLARNNRFAHLPLNMLADVALQVRVLRCTRGTILDGLLSRDRYCLIYEGEVRSFDGQKTDPSSEKTFTAFDCIGPDLVEPSLDAVLEVSSSVAVLIVIPPIPELKATKSEHVEKTALMTNFEMDNASSWRQPSLQ